ncbi:deoxyribodipyrimidine photo-lyase [Phaeobacter gallaeciensis]|uniref:cryptochrome/photolyase family protein n=1 Tax=Phaeobacter gallaeciensis TaxID=60890 RepID=UPI00237EF2EC|nr:deoxyribodipyrimidine photo-lyase [Phaeobacter gallaeciensis]MDE4302795.1 deoxyribodipyrimidine photo-lyase [Phaeobacter gallaeciensis]MDE4307112.1 deoxyribodipyrimidine photo-lyase [Phaeobacter gallaeciensis]MDE4311577.1 deoxyribodipyrimidine photo-lyase [Phaeobacter gallaeciensis]MDE4316116.1 deoxyribodipyrimidine photo-lyase [Phaeobacter gallaeciensis]MDE4320504.1 deoxyribodipyrimidine photo-lyase [Phaeobacter gallaeciensis]
MTSNAPVIWWIRRDLRLADNPALTAAARSGAPVIPLYILDAQDKALGAAPKFRLGLGLEKLAETLSARGSRLIFRRGDAQEVLRQVIDETGAGSVVWSRLYDPEAIARDTAIKEDLKASGIAVQSQGGRLLFEPWTVETKAGGMFKVYTPFWKAVRDRQPADLLPEPGTLPAPERWPVSDRGTDWQMGAAMRRGADIVRAHCNVGEQAALDRLDGFLEEAVTRYKDRRDYPGEDATSNLSENLAWGEISPHRMWHLGQRAMAGSGKGAEHFLKEVVWREFAYHLMYHSPQILTANWRPEWDGFGWSSEITPDVEAWQRGQTGYDFVDAAMREMYVTGRMHNRSRMIVASFLTKHLMVHWKVGMDWFADCLVDWDPAANAMGWQWTAGSGPDAAPFFRIYNPEGQIDKFDADRRYVRRWIAEGQRTPPQSATSFFDAAPLSWGLSPDQMRARPLIDLKAGRERALEAYGQHRSAGQEAG